MLAYLHFWNPGAQSFTKKWQKDKPSMKNEVTNVHSIVFCDNIHTHRIQILLALQDQKPLFPKHLAYAIDRCPMLWILLEKLHWGWMIDCKLYQHFHKIQCVFISVAFSIKVLRVNTFPTCWASCTHTLCLHATFVFNRLSGGFTCLFYAAVG